MKTVYMVVGLVLWVVLSHDLSAGEAELAVAPTPFAIRSSALGVDFVYLPSGRALMFGTAPTQERWANVSPFWCARRPVTKGMVRRYFEATAQAVPERFGPAPELVYRSEEQWHQQGGLSMPTDGHLALLLPDEISGYLTWVGAREGRRVELMTEAQFDLIRGSGMNPEGEFYWWQHQQTGGVGAWISSQDYQGTAPEQKSFLPGLYTQTPWRIFLITGSYLMRDHFLAPNEVLPPGDFDDPITRHADPAWPMHAERTYPYPSRTPYSKNRKTKFNIVGIWLVSEVLPGDAMLAVTPPVRLEPPAEPIVDLPKVLLDCGKGVTLALRQVPAGRFTMGRSRESRPWTDEWPETEVELGSYWLGETEVTQAQFRAVTGLNPSLVPGDDRPVHNISFVQMLAFCDLLTTRERAAGHLGMDEEYRCPTEPEWEMAAMAGARTRYAFGDDPADLPFYAWVDVPNGPFPVGTKRPNRWGFFDMSGNVMEQLWDRKITYPGTLVQGQWLEGGGLANFKLWRGARGGAWNMGAEAAVPTIRRAIPLDSRCYHIGFRLARGPTLNATDMNRTRFDRESYVIDPEYRAILEANGVTPPPLSKK